MSEVKGTRALELWCKRLVKDCPDVHIENMTTSWRNGMAFCALVHHFRPDLIDMKELKPENIYENNQLAFNVAEKHLGIPALLDPEDMVENDVPDRLSVLTYLSQFYQRLGHTVNTKVSENEPKPSANMSDASLPVAPIKFGKAGLDKCTACSLPVYLAQRLMVSHKLYHRRCFRCSKCNGHLNPKNYDILEGSEFTCDSCKNEQNLLKYLNNNDCDQMGMLVFGDSLPDAKLGKSKDDVTSPKLKSRPSSVLEKINMFEKNSETDSNIDIKVANLSIRNNSSYKDLINNSGMQSEVNSKSVNDISDIPSLPVVSPPEKTYKSNIDKFNFLQTQLSGDSLEIDKTADDIPSNDLKTKNENNFQNEIENITEIQTDTSAPEIDEESNVTDDSRISKIPLINPISVETKTLEEESPNNVMTELKVPPRRKKQASSEKVTTPTKDIKESIPEPKEYPDHLNPFGTDDEEEKEESNVTLHKPSDQSLNKESTNPFGSSDEEDDEVPPIQPLSKPPVETSTPVRRVIAVNPFWSDGEEPSSDEEDIHNSSSKSTYSSLTTSTPNLVGSTPRRRKPKAPPPPVITITESSHTISMDDVASISSLSSYNSTVHSDQKSYDRSTPVLKKKRPAPTPPGSLCNMSACGGSLEKGVDGSDLKNASGSESGRRVKGPAPGLPLPERREVKLQMSPEELQVQLDLLETQQLGLERQGVLIERMIRDKCEGDEACTAPQEEVEDLVIQLCELVNEKNDLFRKQTELMYIRRQQRLEQEQADIEHEIRIIQSRPAVNRIDADKVREEQLVARLVEIVLMRDELVQQIDAERRRERQEDLAIAASIASKRAQRNSGDSNHAMKTADVSNTHKKSKVKDKVKKQLKKAKHTLISKKKDDSPEKKGKDEKSDKEKKPK